MPTSLISTKLNPPQARLTLVPRPRLLQKLSRGLSRRLTLISAPPGFGKTTLLAEWISERMKDEVGRACPEQGEGMNEQPVESFHPSSFILHPSKIAWLTLDEGDNDPARFFAYLVAALQKVDPAVGQGLQPLFSSGQLPSVDALLAGLLNDLAAASGDLALVLDDYHSINNPAVHQALQFFTEHLPANTHLVVISREDPPLPLPRLRARGEVVEIRENELRFTLEEARAFFLETMGLDIEPQAADSLNQRAEGWVAGLQMAALAIQSPLSGPHGFDIQGFIASFRGTDRFIMDYLLEEVFRRQPEDIQQFLLQTSILDRMCASLCDAITDEGRQTMDDSPSSAVLHPSSVAGRRSSIVLRPSSEILDFLDRSNLFIVPLDNQREWYRYHRLFGDLLRYRLQAGYPDRLPELHRRAAVWFAESGEPDEAVRHALAASDFNLAARLVEGYMLQFLGNIRVATCLSWIQAIPQEVIVCRAYLCAGCGWVYAILSQAGAAREYVEAGEAALAFYEPIRSIPEGRRISAGEVRGHLAAIRAYTDRLLGEFQAAVIHSEQALAELPAEAGSVRCVVSFNLGLLQLQHGNLEMARRSFVEAFESAQRSGENLYIAVSALSLLGNVAALQGKLGEAGRCYQRAIEIGTVGPGKTVPLPAVCYACGGLVALYYQRDEIALAGKYLDEAYPLAVQIGQEETISIAMIYYALLAQARGEFDLAEEWLDQAAGLLEVHPQREGILAEYLAARVGLLLAHGDASAAARLLDQNGVKLDVPDVPLEGLNLDGPRLAEFLLLARVLLVQGAVSPAVELLKRVAVAAEAAGNIPVLIEALAFRSVSVAKTQEAISYLERALSLGAAEGYVRPFLNAGTSLVKLLRQAIVEDFQPGYAHRLLTALEGQTRRGAAYRPGGAPAGGEEERASIQILLEPLTGRERQVLRLLAAGLSSTEVAGELVLSTATVRSYMKSLYAKLDAHNREEAIEKGHTAGVI